MEYLVSEDRPHTDIWMRLILGLPVAALAIGSIFAMQENMNAGLVLLGEAVLIGLVFICIIPVAYRIYKDKIQIAFRVPWAFNIPFSSIETLRPSRWFTTGINLPTCFSMSKSLDIVRIKRMSVTISPADRQAFIDQFQEAYAEWRRNR